MTNHLYIAVYLPPKVKSSITIYLTPFTSPSYPLPSGNHHTIVCVNEVLSVCFYGLLIHCVQYYIPQMNEIMWLYDFPCILITTVT